MFDFILKPILKTVIACAVVSAIVTHEIARIAEEKEEEKENPKLQLCDLCDNYTNTELGSGLLCTDHYSRLFPKLNHKNIPLHGW